MRNPIMVGQRVYLRPLEEGDAELLAQFAAQEPEPFWEHRMPLSPIAFTSWIRDAYTKEPPEHIAFAVCLKENDQFIGTVDLWSIDWVNRTAETGSYIGPVEFRGKGYGPEAKHLLLEYAFDRIQLHMVYSCVWEPNFRSAAAVRRQGYREAGRFKGMTRRDGRYRDWLMFDLLRDEWLAAREEYRRRLAERTEREG